MSRDEFIAKVRAFAVQLAEEHECGECTVDEDRQKGIWGERMTAWLEEKCGGDCSTNVKWTGGESRKVADYDKEPRPERMVELRFRFSNPCVSVSLDYRREFAEIEFSDFGEGLTHTGVFELHETHAWGERGGFDLLSHVMEEWEKVDA